MNAQQQVDQLRRRFHKLAAAKRLCVESGDRVAVAMLGDCIRRVRDRLIRAERRDYLGVGIFTPRVEPFATPNNRADNPASEGR